jgi:pre-60S factor REI1
MKLFASAEEQREHYKSDLHRFNLKRKVAGLPPVGKELFEKKMADMRREETEADRGFSKECVVCHRRYSSKAQYEQHMASRKHKDTLRAQSERRTPLCCSSIRLFFFFFCR